MKKILISTLVALLATIGASAQFNLKDALNGLSSGSSTGSKISDAIGVINAVVGSGSMKAEDLVGKWTYSKPAVAFQSDNLLEKAGGAAAAQMIVDKITPYYNKLGVKGLTMEFTSDGNFTIKRGAMTVSGTYTAGDNGQYLLNIKALGKIPAGKLTVYITGNSKTMQVTCAADKLLTFVSKVGGMTGNSTLKSLSSILNNYKGLNIGLELKK